MRSIKTLTTYFIMNKLALRSSFFAPYLSPNSSICPTLPSVTMEGQYATWISKDSTSYLLPKIKKSIGYNRMTSTGSAMLYINSMKGDITLLEKFLKEITVGRGFLFFANSLNRREKYLDIISFTNRERVEPTTFSSWKTLAFVTVVSDKLS